MKCFKLLLTSFILAGVTLSVQAAAFQPFVPVETMKIAHEAEIRASKAKPSSDVVRVGIATTGFGTYEYSEISVFGTDNIEIFNNGMPVVHIKTEHTQFTTLTAVFLMKLQGLLRLHAMADFWVLQA